MTSEPSIGRPQYPAEPREPTAAEKVLAIARKAEIDREAAAAVRYGGRHHTIVTARYERDPDAGPWDPPAGEPVGWVAARSTCGVEATSTRFDTEDEAQAWRCSRRRR